LAISVEPVLSVPLGSTGVDSNVKIGRGVTETSWEVDTMDVVIVTLKGFKNVVLVLSLIRTKLVASEEYSGNIEFRIYL
jgi:hypothetical protein